MEQVPQNTLIVSLRANSATTRSSSSRTSCGAKLLNRSHFSQLHSGSTGLSIGAHGGSRSRLNRSAN